MILKKKLSFLTQEILMKSLNFQLKTYLLLKTLMKVVFLYFQFLFFYLDLLNLCQLFWLEVLIEVDLKLSLIHI